MKISQLTPEQKTRLLCEVAGWTWRKSTLPYQRDGWWSPDNRGPFTEREMFYDANRNGSWNSYDATIPLVQKLNVEVQTEIMRLLIKLTGDFFQWNATPSQLCDAVLVVTGKAEL